MLVMLALLAVADLPVTEVTVFSDRARVTRSGSLPVAGRQRLALAVLTDAAEPSSLNVEVAGAELENIELLPVDPEQLPMDEARTLVKALDENGDQLTKLSGERSALQEHLGRLQGLRPSVPNGGANAPPPKLNAQGWAAALGFAVDQAARLQARKRELSVKIDALNEKREELRARAALLGSQQRPSGLKVVATVKGSGSATFTLRYLATRCRWLPTYDVQLQPDTGKVQVSFAGLVSQESGEDWSDAALTLSTAVPAQAAQLPKPLTWKIGTRERFIPTPAPLEQVIRPPPAPAAVSEADRRDEDALRARLLGEDERSARTAEESERPALPNTTRPYQPKKMRPAPVVPSPGAIAAGDSPPPPAPPPPPQVAPKRTMDFSSADVDEEREVLAVHKTSSRSRPAERRTEMSLRPPPGWVAPRYAPELPASAAAGYDLSWPSLQRETIQSGKGSRRVALFSQSWPVTTERKLYPALFGESFLVAELKNPAQWPLPAGTANLYVGLDPAGSAQLKLVSPGEKFALPLGIDRALKPVRNVRVVDAEKGVFSKDDFSEYTVSIEVANPYRTPTPIRVYDQIPVTSDKEVEVALLESRPPATVDAVRGHLEWRLVVPPNSKSQLSFKYTLKRPKGWRMNQWEAP